MCLSSIKEQIVILDSEVHMSSIATWFFYLKEKQPRTVRTSACYTLMPYRTAWIWPFPICGTELRSSLCCDLTALNLWYWALLWSLLSSLPWTKSHDRNFPQPLAGSTRSGLAFVCFFGLETPWGDFSREILWRLISPAHNHPFKV